MADVLIDKYRVKVVRQGTTPANPGNVTTDPLPPVNPPGTGDVPPISFLQLTDTPTTYASQALKVVRVNSGETGLEFTTVDVLGTVLTGYTVGSNTALAATDTILHAFGKVQGQINARVSGSGTSGQVAFWNGTSSQTGDTALTWDNVNKRLLISPTNTGAETINLNLVNLSTAASTAIRLKFTASTGVDSQIGGAIRVVRLNTPLNGASEMIFSVSEATTQADRWKITSAGFLEGVGNCRIRAASGSSLTLSDSTVDNLVLVTSRVGVLTNVPTNTLDVNGTARIRSVSNATGNFVTLSATGVLQQRTAAEVLTDLGIGSNLWSSVGSGNIFRNSRVHVGGTSDPNGRLQVSGSTTVRGISLNTTVAPTANNQTTTMLDIQPSYNNTGFTGIKNYDIVLGQVGFTNLLNAFSLNYVTFDALATSFGIAVLARPNGTPTGTSYAFQFNKSDGTNSSNLLFVGGGSASGGSNILNKHVITTSSEGTTTGQPIVIRCAGDNQSWTLVRDHFTVFKSGNIVIQNTANSATDNGFQFEVVGTSNFNGTVNFAGNTSFSNAINIGFGTTTGTKIGTATTQKLAFWNATPIVQPLETALANTPNTGDANTDALITALKNVILNTGLARSA